MLPRITALIGFALFASGGAFAQEPAAVLDTATIGKPAIETYCSRTHARVGGARISWNLQRDTRIALRLEFAVTKDGFERGLFGTVAADGRDTTVELAPLLRRNEILQQPFAVLVVAAQAEGVTGMLDVEALDPGVNYYWRLRADAAGRSLVSETARIQGRTCPTDEAEDH